MPDVMKQIAALKKKHGRSKFKVAMPNLREEHPPQLSNTLRGCNGYKRDPMAHKWKRGCAEKPETVREIEAKKTRIAPLFNKGAYGYLTPETDAKTIGRK